MSMSIVFVRSLPQVAVALLKHMWASPLPYLSPHCCWILHHYHWTCFWGGSCTLIHSWTKCFTISQDLLVVRILPALNHVNWSIIWRYQTPCSSSCRPIATVLLYWDTSGKPTTGLSLLLLYLWHISHSLTIFCKMMLHTGSLLPELLRSLCVLSAKA